MCNFNDSLDRNSILESLQPYEYFTIGQSIAGWLRFVRFL